MTDPRCYPLVDLSPQQVRAMLCPILNGAAPREVARAEGGLVNTVYRVTMEGGEAAYGLRVYAAGRAAFERERRMLSGLRNRFPAPVAVFADASGRRCAYPYMVYRWIEGITLNEARKRIAPEAFLALAEPLGRLLARLSSISLPAALFGGRRTKQPAAFNVSARLARASAQLRAGLARERLGGPLAYALRRRLERSASMLCELGRACGLVHGDFGGRNILAKETDRDGWMISGVLDWEEAAAGAALWDVGSLFRYPRRYSVEFRELFARGCGAAGGRLPRDWWRLARLLDATRLVAILSEEQELSSVHAECCELIADCARF